MTYEAKTDETPATGHEPGEAKLLEVGDQEAKEAVSGPGDLGRYIVEFA